MYIMVIKGCEGFEVEQYHYEDHLFIRLCVSIEPFVYRIKKRLNKYVHVYKTRLALFIANLWYWST